MSETSLTQALLSKTELLYASDGMLTEFCAVVTEAGICDDGRYYAMTDRTAFFPGGGGQQADTGMFLSSNDDRICVTEVFSDNGRIFHITERELKAGEKVRGIVNADVRYRRMQIHGAEHIISGLIHSTFGYDNSGFHMSDDIAVFDVNGPLSAGQISDIEMRANKAVFENRPITISFPDPKEARELSYRSKLDTYENIRLVTIEGTDVCACCAPHVASTGQLGVIKIIDHMPHRGGTRMTLTAGMSAYEDYTALHCSNAQIMEALSSKREMTAIAVRALVDRQQAQREEIAGLKRAVAKAKTAEVINRIERRPPADDGPELIFSDTLDIVGLRDLVNECTKVFSGIVCAFLAADDGFKYIFAVCAQNADNADLPAFTADFNKNCGGKGGGSPVMAQGSTTADRDTIEAYLNNVGKKRRI